MKKKTLKDTHNFTVPTVSGGMKHDRGKTRYDLFTYEALEQIGRVLTHGADKYSDRNWESGIKYGRLFAAAMRHLWKWWGGEKLDPETGLNHLAHAGCCIIFLLTYEERNMGEQWDDRSTATK